MQNLHEMSERVPISIVSVVPLSKRSLKNLILKLECLGFLTPTVRREYPNRLPIFGAEVLETILYELAVSPSVISVARNLYNWEFKALINDLASGCFFRRFNRSSEVFDLSQAKSYGRTILAALEVAVARLKNANRWITKLDEWPQPTFNDVSCMQEPEQSPRQMRDHRVTDFFNIERVMFAYEQMRPLIN